MGLSRHVAGLVVRRPSRRVSRDVRHIVCVFPPQLPRRISVFEPLPARRLRRGLSAFQDCLGAARGCRRLRHGTSTDGTAGHWASCLPATRHSSRSMTAQTPNTAPEPMSFASGNLDGLECRRSCLQTRARIECSRSWLSLVVIQQASCVGV